jgi:hypothetical protein
MADCHVFVKHKVKAATEVAACLETKWKRATSVRDLLTRVFALGIDAVSVHGGKEIALYVLRNTFSTDVQHLVTASRNRE